MSAPYFNRSTNREPGSRLRCVSLLLLGGAMVAFIAAFMLARPPQLDFAFPSPTPTLLSGAATEAAYTPPPTALPSDTPNPAATPLPTNKPYPTPILAFSVPGQLSIARSPSIDSAGACWTSYQVAQSGNPVEISALAGGVEGAAWAVGHVGGAKTQTLLLRWQDGEWQAIASPNEGDGDNRLDAVAADGTGGVWVSGSWSDGNNSSADNRANDTLPLLAHWDGGDWRLVDDPLNYAITAIASFGADDLWGVSSYSLNDANTQTAHLFLHQRGDNWLMLGVSLDDPPPFGFLRSMVARDASDIWAAGGQLIVHWDGKNWSQSPFTLSASFSINAIAASGPNDAWAVGERDNAQTQQATALLLHWNGAAWTTESSAAPPDGADQRLRVVAATSPADVWAAGVSGDGLLLLHWDGAAWSAIPIPTAIAAAELTGIARDPTGVWLAGNQTAAGTGVLLRYTQASCALATP